MKILQIENKKDLFSVTRFLESGEVIVLPTDTIYGLSCLANNRKSIEFIYKIKKRPRDRRFIILLSDLDMLKRFFYISGKQEDFLNNFYKKKEEPTSFILKPKREVKNWLELKNEEGVAVRLPKNKFLIKIIKELKTTLISTSCNLSGERSLNDVFKIIRFLKEEKIDIKLIVKRGYSFKTKRSPSAIIDIRNTDSVKKIR